MRRRGFTLIAVMWFAALVFALSLASHGLVGAVRARLAHHKAQQAAASMAVSGADYAQAMVRQGRWTGTRSFTSPDLDGGGWFEVQVRSTEVTSTGHWGEARATVIRRLP